MPDSHVSGYATAHPSEDWAETFAHYLHLRDGLETVDAFGFDRPTAHPDSLPSMLQRWHRVTSAVNEINLGLGHPRVYPFELTPMVETKLGFVHRQVSSRRNNADHRRADSTIARQVPVHSGGRFSANARGPSFASFDVNTLADNGR